MEQWPGLQPVTGNGCICHPSGNYIVVNGLGYGDLSGRISIYL
jgi:hypothetical protein